MNKFKRNNSQPRLEYLQDPRKIETSELLKPLYEADEELRKKLRPSNIKKELKEGYNYFRASLKELRGENES